MLTEETISFDQIEVRADGAIQVREARVIFRDGVRDEAIPARYHRYVLDKEIASGLAERIREEVAALRAANK